MRIQLTPEEQNLLLWEPNDFLDVIAGTVSITGQFSERPQPDLEQHYIQFLFRTGGGKSYDIRMYTSTNLPNGPALLVRYCRPTGGTTFDFDAFGLVSLVNGSWTHLYPFEKSSIITDSKRFKTLFVGQIDTAVNRATNFGIKPLIKIKNPLTQLLGSRFVKSGIARVRDDEQTREIYSAMRLLMDRIAHDSSRYRGGGDNVGSGKL